MPRTRLLRFAAALAVFGLGLGAVAPVALACDMGEAADSAHHGAPAGTPAQPPCHPPAEPASDGSAPAPEPVPAVPVPGSVACCTATAVPARVSEQAPPAAAGVPTVEARAPRPAAPRVLRVSSDAESPPGPPGPLHLLHGCFLI